MFHPNAKGHTYFSEPHGMFSKTDHILGHKASLIQKQKTNNNNKKETTLCILFYNHILKLVINNNRDNRKIYKLMEIEHTME